MNKNLGIGIAAAVIAAGLVYLYKRRSSNRTEAPVEPARSRHRTDVFAKAKAAQSAATSETPAM